MRQGSENATVGCKEWKSDWTWIYRWSIGITRFDRVNFFFPGLSRGPPFSPQLTIYSTLLTICMITWYRNWRIKEKAKINLLRDKPHPFRETQKSKKKIRNYVVGLWVGCKKQRENVGYRVCVTLPTHCVSNHTLYNVIIFWVPCFLETPLPVIANTYTNSTNWPTPPKV